MGLRAMASAMGWFAVAWIGLVLCSLGVATVRTAVESLPARWRARAPAFWRARHGRSGWVPIQFTEVGTACCSTGAPAEFTSGDSAAIPCGTRVADSADEPSLWAIPQRRRDGGGRRAGPCRAIVRTMLGVGLAVPPGRDPADTSNFDDRFGHCGYDLASGTIEQISTAYRVDNGPWIPWHYFSPCYSTEESIERIRKLRRANADMACSIEWPDMVRPRHGSFPWLVSIICGEFGRSDSTLAAPCAQ